MSNSQNDYLLSIRVQDTQDPTVSRLFSVPPDLTFAELHEAIQIAFGWASCHHWGFRSEHFADPESSWPKRDGLIDIRRAEGWESPNSDVRAPEATKISDILGDEERMKQSTLTYEYDFGDSWEHAVILEGRGLMPGHEPICIAGEGHPVAEDCGSTPGWEDLKKAYSAKRPNPEQKERRDWYENMCANGDEKGLKNGGYEWDIYAVNRELLSRKWSTSKEQPEKDKKSAEKRKDQARSSTAKKTAKQKSAPKKTTSQSGSTSKTATGRVTKPKRQI